MKNVLLLVVLYCLFDSYNILCQENNLQFPTFAEPPGPENVLVVFKSPNNPADTISESIKNYYMHKRSIPSDTHELPIEIPADPPSGITYGNDGEIIQGEGNLGWLFVRDYIADEIENHLNTTYYNGQLLRDLVRYLVLIKGIPLKIDDITSYDLHESVRKDVTVDALLCLINQGTEKHFMQLYGTDVGRSSYPTNPYYYADKNYSLHYRFLTNHFITDDEYKLQYLVSRLDGNEEQDVITMIDNAYIADLTGEKVFD